MTYVRSLVTGAGGFIGSHVAHALAARGDEVHALVHAGSRAARLADVRDRVHVHEIDLTDAVKLGELLHTNKPDHVFHFAASNIASGVRADAEEVIGVNVLGTANLLSAMGDVRSCVTMGSFLEYGPKDRALMETDRCEPPELYSISKLAGTLLSQAVARTEHKPIVALRMFTPYGPQVQQGRLIYESLRKALEGEPLTLTRPSVSRDFVYIDDVVALCLEASGRASEYAGEVFNLGSGTRTTLEELAAAIISVTHSSSRVQWGSFKQVAYDADTWQADMTKTFASFAWRPMVSLTEGLERTMAWMRSERPSAD